MGEGVLICPGAAIFTTATRGGYGFCREHHFRRPMIFGAVLREDFGSDLNAWHRPGDTATGRLAGTEAAPPAHPFWVRGRFTRERDGEAMLVLRRRSEERRCIESDVDLSAPGGHTWRGAQVGNFCKAKAAASRIENSERGVDIRCSKGPYLHPIWVREIDDWIRRCSGGRG